MGRFKPDIVHAHDALRTGVHLLGCRTPWIVSLSGEEYQKLGELSAWRATLWEGDRLLAEQKSFLW